MAFIIKQVPDITVPVDILVPGDDQPSRIDARWKLYGFDAAQARVEAINRGDVTDEQVVREDLIHAGPFRDEQGNEIPYSLDLVLEQLQATYFRVPLLRSWFAAQHCRVESAAKN
jgi:hypothetical protein